MNGINDLKMYGDEINIARRRHHEKKQEELKIIDAEAKAQEQDLKAASEAHKSEIRHSVNAQLLESLDYKDRRLDEMKKSLEDTGQVIGREKTELQKNMENQREERQAQHNFRMTEMANAHREDVVNSNDKLSAELKKLNQRANQAERIARDTGRVEADKIRRENDGLTGMEEKRFQDALFNQDLRNNEALTTQKEIFNNTFKTNETVQNQKLSSQNIRHNHATETTAKQNELTINQSKKDFELKYKTFLDEQQLLLKNLNERVNINVDKLKDAEIKKKQVIENRADDEFYSGVDINPIVSEDAKAYKVKIPLASHEAASANLSGKDRNLKFTFSRNSENTIRLPDGTNNKTKKSETVMKEFSVNEIINERKIEKSYSDGYVTFYVPKK